MCIVYLFILSLCVEISTAAVCDYTNVTKSPSPPPSLAPIFSARVEWKMLQTNTTTVVREVHNSITKIDSQEILMEGQTFKAIVDYDEKQYITYSQETGCSVAGYGNLVFFHNKMWLSPLNMLIGVVLPAKPVHKGSTVIRSTQADWFQACLFFYEQNTTVLIDLYFTRRGWFMPGVSPSMFVPLRIEMRGEMTENGTTTDFHVIGDIVDYEPGPEPDYEFMQLPPGVFCQGKNSRKPINFFPRQFSMTLESIDMDQHTIIYENIWFDPASQLIRRDSKEVTGTDADSTKEIFDFHLGIHYLIDPYMGKCQPVSLLSLGDKYVAKGDNHTIRMQTPFEFFHVQSSQIQYVGFRTTRGISCEVWVGMYLDKSLGYNVTIEWYFGQSSWKEAVNGIVQPSPLVRMDIWLGGSTKPIVKNVLQLDSEAPSLSVFDIDECYPDKHRERIIVHYTVVNNQSLDTVSLSYLRDAILKQLATASSIPPQRITKASVFVSGSDVYFDGLLLDNAPLTNPHLAKAPPKQHGIDAVMLFLNGFVKGHNPLHIVTTSNTNVTLATQALIEVDYKSEFTTTPATTTMSTTFATPPVPVETPTTYKQETPTERTPPLPPLTASTTTAPTQPCTCPTPTCTTNKPETPCKCDRCPTTASTAAATTHHVTTQTATKCNCPVSNTTPNCPTTTPCPNRSCPQCPAPSSCSPCQTTPCTTAVTCPPVTSCPPVTTRPPCTTSKPPLGQHQPNTSNGGVSGGAAAGIAIAMVIIGLLIGLLIPRVIQKYKELRNPDTGRILANHMDDDSRY